MGISSLLKTCNLLEYHFSKQRKKLIRNPDSRVLTHHHTAAARLSMLLSLESGFVFKVFWPGRPTKLGVRYVPSRRLKLLSCFSSVKMTSQEMCRNPAVLEIPYSCCSLINNCDEWNVARTLFFGALWKKNCPGRDRSRTLSTTKNRV